MQSITITFHLPNPEAVTDIIKALGADLAFLEARSNLPTLTAADHPLAASTPVIHPTADLGNVHQLALPMAPKRTRKVNQAKGYTPRNPAVELMVALYRDRFTAAAKGRSTVDNMVAVMDHLAETYGRDAFRLNITNVAQHTGLTVPVVTNAITALGNGKILGTLSGRRRFINWVTR